MSDAAPGQPPARRAAPPAHRLVAGILVTTALVIGLVGFPGASLASAPNPTGETPAETGAARVDTSLPTEDHEPALASVPSRELDAGRVPAILGVAASAMAAGVIVLLELRRQRHRPPAVVATSEPPPTDIDALVTGACEPPPAARRRPPKTGVPVWVARLDADALGPPDPEHAT
jgi:hypothetical protein